MYNICSVAPPSNLPNWWEYNKKLIQEVKEQALTLCPEANSIIQKIKVENALPVQCISDVIVNEGAGKGYFYLLELLNAALPNANHLAMAQLAGEGLVKAIVTTNFDTLIEFAFRHKKVPLKTVVQEEDYYESLYMRQCKLFKIHGSVTDIESLIDTVTQKAKGLSDTKRKILSDLFENSEIIFMGFSGADFDFDDDYIPIAQAIEQGSTVTWIVQPGREPNHNIANLYEKFSDRFYICEKALAEFFQIMGIDYDCIEKDMTAVVLEQEQDTLLEERIHRLFSHPSIGSHGCVGYCISFLNMIGESETASDLSKIYESSIRYGLCY